jgi:hypothetical protein
VLLPETLDTLAPPRSLMNNHNNHNNYQYIYSIRSESTSCDEIFSANLSEKFPHDESRPNTVLSVSQSSQSASQVHQSDMRCDAIHSHTNSLRARTQNPRKSPPSGTPLFLSQSVITNPPSPPCVRVCAPTRDHRMRSAASGGKQKLFVRRWIRTTSLR